LGPGQNVGGLKARYIVPASHRAVTS